MFCWQHHEILRIFQTAVLLVCSTGRHQWHSQSWVASVWSTRSHFQGGFQWIAVPSLKTKQEKGNVWPKWLRTPVCKGIWEEPTSGHPEILTTWLFKEEKYKLPAGTRIKFMTSSSLLAPWTACSKSVSYITQDFPLNSDNNTIAYVGGMLHLIMNETHLFFTEE